MSSIAMYANERSLRAFAVACPATGGSWLPQSELLQPTKNDRRPVRSLV